MYVHECTENEEEDDDDDVAGQPTQLPEIDGHEQSDIRLTRIA